MSHARRTGSWWLTAAAVVGGALATASPAGAQDADYLWLLQDKYRFLTSDQLLSEGYKVCALIEQGVGAQDAAEMVQQDLGVAPVAALDIVSAATVELGC